MPWDAALLARRLRCRNTCTVICTGNADTRPQPQCRRGRDHVSRIRHAPRTHRVPRSPQTCSPAGGVASLIRGANDQPPAQPRTRSRQSLPDSRLPVVPRVNIAAWPARSPGPRCKAACALRTAPPPAKDWTAERRLRRPAKRSVHAPAETTCVPMVCSWTRLTGGVSGNK